MMKKLYSKPALEIEEYQLNKAIATNCSPIITWGPEAPGHSVCKEFENAFDVVEASVLYSSGSGSTPFYDDGSANCDCYYSAGGNTYFTS